MWEIINKFSNVNQYIPHGHCYLWQTPLVGLHSLSDLFIAIAYYSIPLMLVYFIRQREDIPFKGIFVLFSAFILSCGTGHLMDVITLWYPLYWLSGIIKFFTALISIYTAIELYPLIPKALALPSPLKLESLNIQLEKEIIKKKTAEQEIKALNQELEKRVKKRTEELEKSKLFIQKITEYIPNIIYIFDIEKQENIYTNNFMKELLGYSQLDILNLSQKLLGKIVHPEDLEIVKQHHQKCKNLKPQQYIEIEYRLQDIKNNWHWLRSRDTGFEYDNQGNVTQILGVAIDITKKKETELILQEVNQELALGIKELEERNQEMKILGEINDFLQSCRYLSEGEKIICDLLKPLFPQAKGAIFMTNNNQNLLELKTSWGDNIASSNIFYAEECWCLRRGISYEMKKTSPNLFCPHIENKNLPEASLCVPLIAYGESLGLLYLNYEEVKYLTPQQKRLAETVSKQISLAFSNLKMQETLHNQSKIDALTGLYNRRYLEEILVKEIYLAKRKQQELGIIMIDIDYFKKFNDTFGHDAGDQVLKEVANHISINIRDIDIACRYGGEELTIILLQSSLEIIKNRAEKLRKGIKNLNLVYEGKSLGQITVSMGLSCFPQDGLTPDILIKKADQALYEAKNLGRDRVICAINNY